VAPAEVSIVGKRFLVLDDEFLIALDIQQTLEAAGAASVMAAGNAEDALALLRNEPRFDLAVLDVLLCGAMRTCLPVAAVLAVQKTPFVFLTGMQGEDVHTKKFPLAPVVEKPYRSPLLMDAILRALAAR
jgi:CheY-like chemotaxis protein